jgi:hypothetical protein
MTKGRFKLRVWRSVALMRALKTARQTWGAAGGIDCHLSLLQDYVDRRVHPGRARSRSGGTSSGSTFACQIHIAPRIRPSTCMYSAQHGARHRAALFPRREPGFWGELHVLLAGDSRIRTNETCIQGFGQVLHCDKRRRRARAQDPSPRHMSIIVRSPVDPIARSVVEEGGIPRSIAGVEG